MHAEKDVATTMYIPRSVLWKLRVIAASHELSVPALLARLAALPPTHPLFGSQEMPLPHAQASPVEDLSGAHV